MTGSRSPLDLAPVETFFRRSGLPHLVVDARTGSASRRRRRVLIGVAAGLVLGTVLVLNDLAWWAAVLLGLAIPLVLAGLGYLLLDLGVLALFVHQGRPAIDGLRATSSVAIRALPPLLAVLLFLSLASETWRAFGRLEGWRFGAVLIVFGALCGVILVAGLRRERHALYAPEPGADMECAARATPAVALVEAGVAAHLPPLERLARVNVAVALLVALGIRVLAVGVAVCAAFIVFGVLIVDRALTAEWVGQAPHVLLSLRLGGREVILSEALVRVASTLGAFASLYFVAVALGDARNREQFLDDELDRLGSVMAAWSYYRGALTREQAPRAGAE